MLTVARVLVWAVLAVLVVAILVSAGILMLPLAAVMTGH